jgi:toxin YoeB
VNVQLSKDAWGDYVTWQNEDRRILKRINQLIDDIMRNGHDGKGKPEPLKHEMAGCWSRRITREHRLVYYLEGDRVAVISCRYHYH